MKFHPTVLAGCISSVLAFSPAISMANTDNLKQEIEALKAQNKTIMERLDASMDLIESKGESSSKTTINGYGELHYNNIKGQDAEIDFHRFVLEIGHEFTDSIRFFSEIELEHSIAGEGKAGEFELEQAYIQFDINDSSNVSVGLFLLPIGIINETHEPTSFYGVERNLVEKNVIPATWWEAGVMYSANTDSGFSYDVAIHSGLKVNGTVGNSKFGSIRDGRQKVAKANAEKLAATARIKYTGISGLELATSVQYQSDITQDTTDAIDDATLIEAHAIWNTGNFTVKALVADWSFEGNNLSDVDSQNGAYIETSYKLTEKFGVFARHSEFDYQKKSSAGASTFVNDAAQTDVGFNYWPHEDVVLKFDYQSQNDEAGDSDGINLGLGYQF
jgi:Phosphate-selective porin O and P